MMMALRAHTRGGPEVLVYEEVPVPQPASSEALVEVHAAAITFSELSWDETWRDETGADRTPVTVSHEVSGVVASAAADGRGPTVGAEVYGLIGFNRNGAAAEYVTVPAAHLAERPRSVEHPEAAALPLAALTAWQALVDHAGVSPSDSVLIRGAAGGVGVYAIQFASFIGAKVTAVCRHRDDSLVTSLGAEAVIDADDPGPYHQRFDVVLDAVGTATPEAFLAAMVDGGRLVTLSFPTPEDVVRRHRISASFFIVTPNRDQLAHIANLVDTRRLRPIVGQRFPLAQGRQAFESATRRHGAGKTVLLVR